MGQEIIREVSEMRHVVKKLNEEVIRLMVSQRNLTHLLESCVEVSSPEQLPVERQALITFQADLQKKVEQEVS